MVCLALSQLNLVAETKLYASFETGYLGIGDLSTISEPDHFLPHLLVALAS